jgi:hypothetical protein
MTTSAQSKRPKWVWIIVVGYFVSLFVTLMSLYLIHKGAIPLSDDDKSYYENLGLLDHLVTAIVTVTNGAGALYLFRLRKEALVCFSNALVLSIAWGIWGIFHEHLLRVIPLPSLILSWAIGLLVCRYVSRLIDKGVLRARGAQQVAQADGPASGGSAH